MLLYYVLIALLWIFVVLCLNNVFVVQSYVHVHF